MQTLPATPAVLSKIASESEPSAGWNCASGRTRVRGGTPHAANTRPVSSLCPQAAGSPPKAAPFPLRMVVRKGISGIPCRMTGDVPTLLASMRPGGGTSVPTRAISLWMTQRMSRKVSLDPIERIAASTTGIKRPAVAWEHLHSSEDAKSENYFIALGGVDITPKRKVCHGWYGKKTFAYSSESRQHLCAGSFK